MEIKEDQPVIEQLAADPIVSVFFSREELKETCDEMVAAIKEVLGDEDVNHITFFYEEGHEQHEAMFFHTQEKYIQLGMGLLKRMVKTFYDYHSHGGKTGVSREYIQNLTREALVGVAGHEAGHRVIDFYPLALGITQEEWGQTGISSLANATMDTCDNHRLQVVHPDEMKQPIDTLMDFAFMPGGVLDHAGGKEHILRCGYPLRFTEFDCEAIRQWKLGAPHPETDPIVKKLLEKHAPELDAIATSAKLRPGKRPTKLERTAKARARYTMIADIYKGEYSTDLLKRDKDNQKIHQSISIVAVNDRHPIMVNPNLAGIIEKKLSELDPVLRAELENALKWQVQAKTDYDREHKSSDTIAGNVAKKVGETTGSENAAPTQNSEIDTFELLGPAVHIEELTDELREWLKKLFDEMQKQAQQDMLSELIKKLLEDPEKFLKELEDALNEKLRPHLVPSSMPTHKELEEMGSAGGTPTQQPSYQPVGESHYTHLTELIKVDNREFAEIEDWLDEHFDVNEMIRRWQDAIRIVTKTGNKLTEELTGVVDIGAYFDHQMTKAAGIEEPEKYFVENAPHQHPMTLSILWRTQATSLDQALKMALFLMRIYSAPGIRRYLQLEFIVSQDVDVKSDEENPSPVPVIFSFSQDPTQDYEMILENLKALKAAGSGGPVAVNQDATALRTQRERLLARGNKHAFAIDLWDEAAVEKGSPNAMEQVLAEAQQTQEALRGKAFCFVLGRKEAITRAPEVAYGEGHFLAESSTEKLIAYLDIVVRSMILYKENYSSHIKEMASRELDVDL